MTISHDRITLTSPDAPVVFAALLGVSCSVCAPDGMSPVEIERFANEQGPAPQGGRSMIVNKAELGLGAPTPNPCNQVAGRRHWFLLSQAAAAGVVLP
jgi:hypothetical protein